MTLRVEPAAESTLRCPRDGHALQKVDRESVTIDHCSTCKGAWFDKAELRRVAHDKELERLAQRVREYPAPSAFACPRCRERCVTSFVGDVEVDTCTACHGVWLDGGELEEAKRQIEVNRVLSNAEPGFRSFLRRL